MIRRLFNTYWLLFAFGIAILFRLTAIGRYVTPDESAWLYWSVHFRQALLTGDWANTFQASHPGITTMWLGSLGVQLTLWLRPESAESVAWLGKLAWLTSDYGEPARQLQQFIPITRVIFALVTSLGIVGIGQLVGRNFGRNAAILTTFALALDPFTAGMGSLPMTDSLLALFISLSLLLLYQLHQKANRQVAILLGVCTTLAILSKLPGLLLLPFIPLVLLTARQLSWRNYIQLLVFWAAAAIVSTLLLLPAIWGAPQHLLTLLQASGSEESSFNVPVLYMGRLQYNVGWEYYPLLLIYRLSPVAFVGMGLAFGRKQTRPLALWLLLFTTLFIIGIEQSPSVFDRYLLPITVVWTLLGSIVVANWLQTLHVQKQSLAQIGILSILCAFALTNIAFPLFAYNWLLGGRTVAQRILPTGWGEAYSVAARQLTTVCPNAEGVLTESVPSTAPFFAGSILRSSAFHAQFAREDWAEIKQILPNAAVKPDPDAVIDVASNRAVIWCNHPTPPAPILAQQTFEAVFDQAARLQEVTLYEIVIDNQVGVQLVWSGLEGGESADFTIDLALIDSNNQTIAGRGIPLIDRHGLPAEYWQLNQSYQLETVIPLPDKSADGTYRLALSLFDATGARRGVFFPATESWDVIVPLGEVGLPFR